MLELVLVVVALKALWLAAALAVEDYGRRTAPDGDFDAIIVPGCRALPDGSPSDHLARRVEKAVALWREGRAPLIVLTGGGEPSEAEVAARWARRLGLPGSALVLEERSTSTRENARFAAELVEAQRVLVVSDSYHLLRAGRVFRRYFAEVGLAGVRSPLPARLRNSLREVLAIGWDVVRPLRR